MLYISQKDGIYAGHVFKANVPVDIDMDDDYFAKMAMKAVVEGHIDMYKQLSEPSEPSEPSKPRGRPPKEGNE